MDFNHRARLDISQVSDVRERRGGRGLAAGGGRGLAAGGGGLGILGLLIALALGINPADLTGGGQDRQDSLSTSDIEQRCQTGADADHDEDCRVVGIVSSVQASWRGQVRDYRPAMTQLYSDATTTGCGSVTSAVGPCYCPADSGIYLDLGSFEVLHTQYGASGGELAQANVNAHEHSHHIQNLTGQSAKVQQSGDRQGPQSGSVRLELQADCYGGAWAANAVETGFLTPVTDADIAEGLSTASGVGDDRIHQKSSGRVDPESWTHGSAEQCQQWLRTGLSSSDPATCDTFAVDRA